MAGAVLPIKIKGNPVTRIYSQGQPSGPDAKPKQPKEEKTSKNGQSSGRQKDTTYKLATNFPTEVVSAVAEKVFPKAELSEALFYIGNNSGKTYVHQDQVYRQGENAPENKEQSPGVKARSYLVNEKAVILLKDPQQKAKLPGGEHGDPCKPFLEDYFHKALHAANKKPRAKEITEANLLSVLTRWVSRIRPNVRPKNST